MAARRAPQRRYTGLPGASLALLARIPAPARARDTDRRLPLASVPGNRRPDAHDGAQAGADTAVARSLGCSLRWADKLTERARADAEEERRKLVAMMKAEEKSNRQISAETGIPHATVDRIVSASKANSAEMRQPEPPGIFDDRRQAFAAEEAGQHLADTDRTRQVLAESKAKSDVLYPVGRAPEALPP